MPAERFDYLKKLLWDMQDMSPGGEMPENREPIHLEARRWVGVCGAEAPLLRATLVLEHVTCEACRARAEKEGERAQTSG